MELYMVSRGFFFAFLVAQHILLSKFVADHEDNLGFYGLVTLVLIPVSFWIVTLYYEKLEQYLGAVWFLYSCVFVIMIGVIFGRAVIEDNKLREQEIATCLCTPNVNTTSDHSFFDSKFLKITLCFTPGLMLLLLTSVTVTDENGIAKQLQLMIVMDLFDGIEMIEVLHEDICDKIPMGWEIAVLVAALLFFLLSALEVHQIKFQKPNGVGKSKRDVQTTKLEDGFRKKTAFVSGVFQFVINLAFLVIRTVLWLKYEFDSAIFLAKNVIGLVMVVHDAVEAFTKTDKGDSTRKEAKRRETHEMGKTNFSLKT